MVVCYDSTESRLTPTIVYQMVGRSSRTRGFCYGHILVERTPGTPASLNDAKAYVNDMIDETNVDNDLRNMKSLIDRHSQGNLTVKEVINTKFKDYGDWKISADNTTTEM